MSDLRKAVDAKLAIAPEPTGRVHDYVRRGWGHSCTFRSDDGGLTISGHLFRNPLVGVTPGDWLLLPNGERTTRYRITTTRWMGDPDDMWEFEAVFDPRTVGDPS